MISSPPQFDHTGKGRILKRMRTLYDCTVVVPSVWLALFLLAATIVRYTREPGLFHLEGEELPLLLVGWVVIVFPVVLTFRFIFPYILYGLCCAFIKLCAHVRRSRTSLHDKLAGATKLLTIGAVHGAAVTFVYYLPLSQEYYIPDGFRATAAEVAGWGIAVWLIVSFIRLGFSDYVPSCPSILSKSSP